ncbi:hypothetical protein BIU88_00985 [Chlorobaculum limnaeum]|uniref:PhoP regulatory network protein YrbL n=1 Tax=Chlorobaculum limnaeum TaxID=274537 RepID=A0A1D8D4R6_CHLLM|nr:PhoP regulatory network protein YrbL [Chlorobaculum limnaeum]AOS82848.1 hypothetical protein BIU88_00985 [Chlorobaculum limnaeum]
MLDLSKASLVGKGSSRLCYVHPEDDRKCVKVIYTRRPEINQVEMKHYRRFQRRHVSWELLARPYGFVETSEGEGVVFSLARDFDGEISKPLEHYLSFASSRDCLKHLRDALKEFKSFLFRDAIVVRELKLDNVVFQRISEGRCRLVLIDGVGNNQFLPLANYSRTFARRMLKRKWRQFEADLLERGFSDLPE